MPVRLRPLGSSGEVAAAQCHWWNMSFSPSPCENSLIPRHQPRFSTASYGRRVGSQELKFCVEPWRSQESSVEVRFGVASPAGFARLTSKINRKESDRCRVSKRWGSCLVWPSHCMLTCVNIQGVSSTISSLCPKRVPIYFTSLVLVRSRKRPNGPNRDSYNTAVSIPLIN